MHGTKAYEHGIGMVPSAEGAAMHRQAAFMTERLMMSVCSNMSHKAGGRENKKEENT